MQKKCPYFHSFYGKKVLIVTALYAKSVLIFHCFICKKCPYFHSFTCKKRPYFPLIYMQKASLFCTALHAKSVLIFHSFICKKCPYISQPYMGRKCDTPRPTARTPRWTRGHTHRAPPAPSAPHTRTMPWTMSDSHNYTAKGMHTSTLRIRLLAEISRFSY